MKTKTLALVVMLVLTAATFVQASVSREKEVKNLSDYLNRTIKFPDFAQAKEIEGTVSLIVKVDENRKLKVTHINGSCCEFEKFVENWFKEINEKPVLFSETIGMKKVIINFKLF